MLSLQLDWFWALKYLLALDRKNGVIRLGQMSAITKGPHGLRYNLNNKNKIILRMSGIFDLGNIDDVVLRKWNLLREW